MYSVTNAISAHCNRNAHATESVPCTVAKVALAIFVTLGVGAATFSAIFFTSHLLISSLATSVSIVVLLGGADVCVTICCKKRRDEPVNLLGNFPPDVPNEDNPAIESPVDVANNQQIQSLQPQPQKGEQASEASTQTESNPVPIKAPKVQETPEELQLRMKLMESVFSNVNLFFEIIKFLNPKEICKFTRVCKEWNVWINNENAVLWKNLAQNENYTFLPPNLISKTKQLFLLSTTSSEEKYSNDQMLVATQFLLNHPNCDQHKIIIEKIFSQVSKYIHSINDDIRNKSKKTCEFVEKPEKSLINTMHPCSFRNFINYQLFFQSISLIEGVAFDIKRASDGKAFYFKLVLNNESEFYLYNDNLIWVEKDCIKFYNIESKEIIEHPLSAEFKLASYFENKIVLVSSDSKINKLYIFDIDSKTLTFFTESSCSDKEKIFMNDSFLILLQDTKPSSMSIVKIWQYESTKNMTIQKTTKLKLSTNLYFNGLINNFLYFAKYSLNGRSEEKLIIDLSNFVTVGKDKIEILKESEEIK